MFNKPSVVRMLDHMRDMDPKMWDQVNGQLVIGKNCWTLRTAPPACAGAHAAFGLGLAPRRDKDAKSWAWDQGARGIANAIGVDDHILQSALSRNGASTSPFNEPSWNRYIYDVFRDTVQELTGYDHGPIADHDFPIPSERHAEVVEETLNDMELAIH